MVQNLYVVTYQHTKLYYQGEHHDYGEQHSSNDIKLHAKVPERINKRSNTNHVLEQLHQQQKVNKETSVLRMFLVRRRLV